jgi:hypothetical protein
MARADQFRASDITVWGVTALSVWAVAVLGANVSALVPPSVYAALHASRIEGSTLNQLRSSVAALEDEAARLKRDNSQLLQRFSLSEDATSAVTQRVGALEASLPKLVESQFAEVQKLDNTPTGSIGPKPLAAEANVKLTPVPVQAEQTAAPIADGSSIGAALGFPVAEENAEAQWQQLLASVGTMLIGLSPVLGDADGSDSRQLIVGPLADKSSAAELCGRLDKQGVPCQPVPFAGEPVQRLN